MSKKTICDVLNGVSEQKSNKYLGLPLVIGRSKRQVFYFIKKRPTKKNKNQKTKFLSVAGKEIPLKSVVLALPVYYISCFNYGGVMEKRRTKYTGLLGMTETKDKGGLGFKDLEDLIWLFSTNKYGD